MNRPNRPPRPPNPLVRWWEALSTPVQALIAAPALMILLFLLNLGPFNQPLLRAALYGVLEGGFFAGLLLAATAQEKSKRSGGGAGPPADQQQHPTGDQGQRERDPEDLPGEP